MALQLHFASLSVGASVDQQTGQLSVFELVEEIRTPQLPVHLPAMVISLALIKTGKDTVSGKMLIHLFTPDGQQHRVGQGEMKIPTDQKRMKAVFRFGNFPIHQYGEHRFVVSWVDQNGAKQGEALLDFEVIQATQVAPGVPSSDKPPVSH